MSAARDSETSYANPWFLIVRNVPYKPNYSESPKSIRLESIQRTKRKRDRID
jgi:hypothetical protein